MIPFFAAIKNPQCEKEQQYTGDDSGGGTAVHIFC
jgi:hypothetical protein